MLFFFSVENKERRNYQKDGDYVSNSRCSKKSFNKIEHDCLPFKDVLDKICYLENNNSTGTNGMHNTNKTIKNPVPLTRDDQVQIGPPRGVTTSSNPEGYLFYQRKLMSSFQRIEINNLKSIGNSNPNFLGGNCALNKTYNNDNNCINIDNDNDNNNINNGNFETWNNVSLQPFDNNNKNNMINSTYMNMLEAESNIVAPALSTEQISINSTILSPMISRQDPTRAETINENDAYINSCIYNYYLDQKRDIEGVIKAARLSGAKI